MGKIVTTTGDLLDAALQQAEKMTQRGQDIQRKGCDMAIENMQKLDKYKSGLHENYLKGIRNWRESCSNASSDHPAIMIKESQEGDDPYYQHHHLHRHMVVEDVD
jgi:hypothetical protein